MSTQQNPTTSTVTIPVSGMTCAACQARVQRVLEMLQTELARSMALCGKPDLKSIDRSLVRLHKR